MVDRLTLAGRPLGPLTLGTVSFGLSYGVANPAEIPGETAVRGLLDTAWKGGIRCLDTAAGYGMAEGRVGRWRAATGRAPTVVGKLPALRDTPAEAIRAAVDAALSATRARLRADRLDGFLAHGAVDYARPELRAALARAREDGRIGLAGVSLYDPEQLFQALRDGPPGIVQLPLNLLDRRMIASGALEACADVGVLVLARSVFVQGALLMAPESLPAHLKPLAPTLKRLRALAGDTNSTVRDLSLRWVRDTANVASTVIGVYDRTQLRELLPLLEAPPLEHGLRDALEQAVGDAPQSLADPRKWPAKRSGERVPPKGRGSS